MSSSFDRESAQQLDELQKIVETLRAAHVAAMEENRYLIGLLNALPIQAQPQPQQRANDRRRTGADERRQRPSEGGENASCSDNDGDGHSPQPRRDSVEAAVAGRPRQAMFRDSHSVQPQASTSDALAHTTGELRAKQSWRFFYTADRAQDRSGWSRIKDLELALRAANERIDKYEKQERQLQLDHDHITRVLKAKLATLERSLQQGKEREDELAAEVRALKQECLNLQARMRKKEASAGARKAGAIYIPT